MRIVYFGNGPRGVRCLEALVESGDEVCGVVAHPKPGADVAVSAEKMGLSLLQPRNINDAETIEWVRALDAEIFVLAGYSQIVRRGILSVPPAGTINLHGGRLPEYRGTAPINWQIINGETTGGCSIIYVDEGIDTGDIIAQEYYDIEDRDDAASVLAKTLEIFPRLLLQTMTAIKDGTVKREKQDPLAGCYYTRRYPRDGKIDWKSQTAHQVHNLVRALVKPYPGAFTFLDGVRIAIWRTRLLPREIKGIPGRVPLRSDDGMVVIASDMGLLVTEISVGDSEEAISARDYLRIGNDLT